MRNEIDYTYTDDYYSLLDFKRAVDETHISKKRLKKAIDKHIVEDMESPNYGFVNVNKLIEELKLK